MSWFDTSGIAILAKNALKEAQKQIDKALDIKDDEEATDLDANRSSDKNTTYQKDDSSSPLTESIEVITPATIPGTALTSSCQPSSNMNMIHGNRNSESVNSICNIETKSGFITIQTIITLNLLPEHLGVNNEENCVNDDPISYTLSEQPSIVVETARCLSPITVAPSRSSHHISHAPNSSTKGNLKNYQEYSIDKLNLGVQALNDNTILDKNYEHIEIHMQTSELTHSFEEVHKNKIHTNIFGGTKAQCRENLFYFTDANSQCAIPEICNNSFQNLIDDEIETTTSSDIEIISSPNGGDSSSTHSGVFHASPHKIAEGKGENIDLLLSKKHRRHIREPSEISIISGNSDESEQLSEVDLLMRRFVEVSESLEQREYRLVELGRKNAELNEQNAQLLTLLESKGMSDVSSDPDGYMHRLSALERKFQLSIREKEQLKSDIDTLRVEAQQTIARNEVEKVLMERDAMITELRTEGEILSKQVLQHSNIIKKLRSTEKENDVLIRKQRDELIKLVEEAERLKRSLSAKEEVERSQIDAVHKLTSEKKKLECDCTTLNGYLDDQVQKYETLRKSFDFARKEFNDRSDLIQDIQKQLNVLKSVEADFEMVKAKNCHLTEQLEYVREQFHRTGLDYEQRLIKTKNEHTELLYRLEAAETRLEEEKNASVLLTIPLMKQIESIQNTMRYKEHAWEQQDSTFYQQLADMLTRVELLSEKEQIQRDNLSTMHQRIVNLESRLVN
ncbi:uncharacterized protein LOC128730114, partial [Anopheles nili]|uniref:uncharacterized protein LOC128730114 n=1 Tax=Anopheles nili TaxID=185578 RepID=UPI00237C2E0A